jgi:hypothetical protein
VCGSVEGPEEKMSPRKAFSLAIKGDCGGVVS